MPYRAGRWWSLGQAGDSQVRAGLGRYLAGGVAGKILPRLADGGFRYAFERKGRHTAFLQRVPTYVITHPQPGLMGAAIAALRL